MSSHKYLSVFEQLDHVTDQKDMVKFFKREFKFLDIFLSLQRITDESNMLEDVTQKIQDLFQDAALDFSELHLAKNFDICSFNMQNKIWSTKMEIRAKYSFPEISLVPLSAKFVMEFIDTVVENLRDLVKIDDSCSLLYAPETMEHIKDVLKELNLLQTFVCFISERFIESQSQHAFFTHVLVVAGHASMLFWLYLPGNGSGNQDSTPEEINALLSDFLQMRIKPIQPCIRKIYVDVHQALRLTIQSGCYPNIQNEQGADSEASFVATILQKYLELPTNSNSRRIVALKENMAILQLMLKFLRTNIIYLPMQDLEILLRNINTVILDALVIYSLYEDEEKKEDMAPGEVSPARVLDFPGNLKRIITMIYLNIRKVFQSNLPGIHGLGCVDILLKNLKEFRRRYSNSLSPHKKPLEEIQEIFERLEPFLKAVAEGKHNKLEMLQNCAAQLMSKAYEVEYIVNACISKKVPYLCRQAWLLDIIQEITCISAEIQKKKMVEDTIDTDAAHTSLTLARTPRMNEEIVGFEDVIETLRDQLIRGTKERDVIAIVGMPGLGKTTLANRLYSDRSVVSHFDIRAQCCVSQVYTRKGLLLAILRDVKGENSQRMEKHAEDLADELCKALLPKRYLILVDDVWEASVWDDLIGCFQGDNNGSRIILTTRNLEVANYARFRSDPFSLRMFTDDESWKLLEKKVFGEETCSPLLTDIGREIAKKCGQLPLSVALVAGILAESEKKEECWEQVANNLGPHIHNDSRAIIEHSYHNLPYYLRSCFLYFGSFLEDGVINVSKLTWLWISEGFIKCSGGKSLEDIAEGYLESLIGRNKTKRSSRGKIKACRIHDLLHDFCKERGKEENLILWITRDQNDNPSSHVHSHKQLAHRISISDAEGSLDESAQLFDLETLSTVTFYGVEDMELILRKIPNLRKLRCDVGPVGNFQYHVLDIPTRLETLKISRHSCSHKYPETIPFCISAPNLKKLTLSDFYLYPQHLSGIALLQNLEVLKLSHVEYDNKEWEVSDGEFPHLKLKVLKLEKCNVQEWSVADDAFPELERLVLSVHWRLKEIPSYFGDISSLKSIEVKSCKESVDKSARDIRKMQVEDYQNADFKVFINGRMLSGDDDDDTGDDNDE
ncbi:putative late blight resistance protein -like r1a-4 [Nicotiana attenuata]|uniref:Late blight resistance protein -like r1a-4 n=1 Tax=Nicotiana attenuata TaxID=49451 RepID=A0A1J6JVP8_NICAT|nr:putative late blight resistance protein -like r1a-4 [Nicotiana attenuata]